MNILRDKRLTTKILILLEISTNPNTNQRDLAHKFDITVQAVSDYFKIMRKEGLVRKVGRTNKPTQKGILFMHSNFSEIRSFIDEQIHTLNIIDLCTATGGSDLRPGDRVGLFMEKGELKAYKDRSSTSMGIVISEAQKDQDVGVKELEGIVKMDLGELLILQVPSVQDGGSRAIDLKAVKKKISSYSPDRIGTLGAVARVVLRRVGNKPEIEFSVPSACLEACQKGLRILVISEERGAHEIMGRFSEYNMTSEGKIRYNLESLAVKRTGSRKTR